MMRRDRNDRHFKERVKDLLSMHTGERRGTLVLMGVLLLLAGWAVYEQWFREPPARDLAPLQAKMEAWLTEQPDRSTDSTELKLFPFDPNTIGREEWRALGLTDKQIDGVDKYMSKGGRFRTKKDLGRMYSIKAQQFATLEPFILLPDSYVRPVHSKREFERYADRKPLPEEIREATTYERRAPLSIELNTADTTALIALPGIGPAFARSIVKYRNSLGGYVSLDQLSEVYILKDKPDAVLKLKEILILDTLMVQRIPINTCTAEDLAAHPYFRWKLAKPLIAYRTQHGPFASVEDIQGCALIDAALLRKLAPYLRVE